VGADREPPVVELRDAAAVEAAERAPGPRVERRDEPRARKKKRTAKKPDDASVFATGAEGASPERGGDSENAGCSRPRTSLGDGVVKPGGSRIG
jgi:hypothetical protein